MTCHGLNCLYWEQFVVENIQSYEETKIQRKWQLVLFIASKYGCLSQILAGLTLMAILFLQIYSTSHVSQDVVSAPE